MSGYETVIGLEIHIQLKTSSKMFCGCSNVPTGANMQTCPVCLGLPGALPVPNKEAITGLQKLAAALNSKLATDSYFDRKHYYYPDLPKGYQISQYKHPFAEGGELEVETDGVSREVQIERLHLEEDAGKNIHRDGATLVDLNRAGTPLVELVTRPDMHSPAEARVFAQNLQEIIRDQLKIGNANMEKGELRCDANISIHKAGDPLGTKVEIKNMNSFRFMERALEFEVKRQTEELESGGKIIQETRGFVERTGETVSQRSKEGAEDYRYMPEPDIPPFHYSAEELRAIKSEVEQTLGEHRRGKAEKHAARAGHAERLRAGGWKFEDSLLDEDPELLGSMIEAAKQAGVKTDISASLIPRELYPGLIKREGKVMADLTETIKAVAGGLSTSAAKKALLEAHKNKAPVTETLSSSAGIDLDVVADKAIEANPGAAADYRSGNSRALDALLGFIMKETRGAADAAQVRKILEEKLQ
jgi:aspartyl-tRNA(Asn)/glutamyl-tRNA(Gln) amidotransferase subunit B